MAHEQCKEQQCWHQARSSRAICVQTSGMASRVLKVLSPNVQKSGQSMQRACSSLRPSSNSRLMLSACARMMGTRMHVAVMAMSGSPQILRVSFTIFISSSLYPLPVMGELCENRLNAYCGTRARLHQLWQAHHPSRAYSTPSYADAVAAPQSDMSGCGKRGTRQPSPAH